MTKEDLYKFPCQFPIKAIGHLDKNIEQQVFDIIKKHVPDLEKNSITLKPSKNKKYIAITITITATSKELLDAIYQDLSACKDIVMTL
jgi:uncharacterized protein